MVGIDFSLVTNWRREWDRSLVTCFLCKKLLVNPCMCIRCLAQYCLECISTHLSKNDKRCPKDGAVLMPGDLIGPQLEAARILKDIQVRCTQCETLEGHLISKLGEHVQQVHVEGKLLVSKPQSTLYTSKRQQSQQKPVSQAENPIHITEEAYTQSDYQSEEKAVNTEKKPIRGRVDNFGRVKDVYMQIEGERERRMDDYLDKVSDLKAQLQPYQNNELQRSKSVLERIAEIHLPRINDDEETIDKRITKIIIQKQPYLGGRYEERLAYYQNTDEKISASSDIKRHIIDSFMNGRNHSVAKLESHHPTDEYGESIARSYVTARDSPLL